MGYIPWAHKESFVSKVMSLLFNMLSMFVIALLPKSELLLFYFFLFFKKIYLF